MRDTRIPASDCWSCGTVLDGAADFKGSKVPGPGSVSICYMCGALAIFQDDLTLRRATDEEREQILKNQVAVDYVTAVIEAQSLRSRR